MRVQTEHALERPAPPLHRPTRKYNELLTSSRHVLPQHNINNGRLTVRTITSSIILYFNEDTILSSRALKQGGSYRLQNLFNRIKSKTNLLVGRFHGRKLDNNNYSGNIGSWGLLNEQIFLMKQTKTKYKENIYRTV
ncbi:hypothetical protein HS088_TW01G00433 [Tripterygium wilfordii]|uniref:Uncharacterized protein n=1 Tax=Tripterygium wilfordii TaxID=458696 RepID=A0A7J7E1N8_TRIWF|nr:hypothetical protein HS088_TW01G00433 [Tripterygium wilfordii]